MVLQSIYDRTVKLVLKDCDVYSTAIIKNTKTL